MSAAMQGEMQPTIYRFKLGGFEVATILDSKAVRSGLTPAYGGEAGAADVKALGAANRIEADRYEHTVHADAGQYRQGAGTVRHW